MINLKNKTMNKNHLIISILTNLEGYLKFGKNFHALHATW